MKKQAKPSYGVSLVIVIVSVVVAGCAGTEAADDAIDIAAAFDEIGKGNLEGIDCQHTVFSVFVHRSAVEGHLPDGLTPAGGAAVPILLLIQECEGMLAPDATLHQPSWMGLVYTFVVETGNATETAYIFEAYGATNVTLSGFEAAGAEIHLADLSRPSIVSGPARTLVIEGDSISHTLTYTAQDVAHWDTEIDLTFVAGSAPFLSFRYTGPLIDEDQVPSVGQGSFAGGVLGSFVPGAVGIATEGAGRFVVQEQGPLVGGSTQRDTTTPPLSLGGGVQLP